MKNGKLFSMIRKKNRIFYDARELSFSQICNIMGATIPKNLRYMKKKKNFTVNAVPTKDRENRLFFVLSKTNQLKWQIYRALEHGAVAIFAERSDFEKEGLIEANYPVILLDDLVLGVSKLCNYILNNSGAKILAMTGTVGKTTTKMFLDSIMSPEYKTYISPGNTNSYQSVLNHIFEFANTDIEFFIQEVGAGRIGSVEKCSLMLKPDGVILLNVSNHHINTYGSYESLFADKVTLADNMRDDGVIVVNYDDEGLANYSFKQRVVSIGIDTSRSVEYRAVNIFQNNELLEFDVLHNDNTAHVAIHILGEHNVIDALSAYALANQYGVREEKIIERLGNYQTKGIRQNLQNIGGYHLFLDCYNCSAASIRTSIQSCEKFKVKTGNKKIVVLSGENKLGEKSYKVMYDLARELSTSKVDKIICFGKEETDIETTDTYGYAQALYDGFVDGGMKEVSLVTSFYELVEILKTEVNQGDLLLLKGIWTLEMVVAVDMAFSTSFAYEYNYYIHNADRIEDSGFSLRCINLMDEVDIVKAPINEGKVTIPNEIHGKKVFCIGGSLFKNSTEVTEIQFGNSVKNIGRLSFYGCTQLKEIHIPSNVRIIGRAAFRNCKSLESVVIEEGTIEISSNAFRNDVNLEKIVLPDSIGNIGDTVFENCSKLEIICKAGSYAEKYAIENKLKYRSEK